MSQVESLTSSSPDIAAGRRVVTEKGGGAIGSTLVAVRDTLFLITDTSAGAYTLALPTAGIDDGKELTFVDLTGHAHTITTPASGINGSDHIATFGGTAYTVVTFRAYNGGWLVGYSVAGITLS